jgi:hypothetical protein
MSATRIDTLSRQLKPLRKEAGEERKRLLQHMIDTSQHTIETDSSTFMCKKTVKRPPLSFKTLGKWLGSYSDSEGIIKHLRAKRDSESSESHKLVIKSKD